MTVTCRVSAAIPAVPLTTMTLPPTLGGALTVPRPVPVEPRGMPVGTAVVTLIVPAVELTCGFVDRRNSEAPSVRNRVPPTWLSPVTGPRTVNGAVYQARLVRILSCVFAPDPSVSVAVTGCGSVRDPAICVNVLPRLPKL